MTTYRNDAKNRRGVLLSGGTYAFLNPGETKTIPSHQIVSVPNGLVECDPEASDTTLARPPERLTAQLDEPPALSGMNKAQLTEQAEKEGVKVDAIHGTGQGGKVTNADIVAAIEAQRSRSEPHDSDDS
jgi:pyruvate/2-oxoglutarate dehydrogenase complex dihydrolipoamide acyltransferase (E2) component